MRIRLLCEGANPTLKDVIISDAAPGQRGGTAAERPEQRQSGSGVRILVDAGGAAAEAKATLRRYVDGILAGTTTDPRWAVLPKREMYPMAAALLSEEAELGESAGLLSSR